MFICIHFLYRYNYLNNIVDRGTEYPNYYYMTNIQTAGT